MIDAEQPGGDTVDRLVRDYLDRETAETDAAALLARVRASRAQPVHAVAARRRWPRAFTWSVSTVAAVVLAFFGGRHLGSDSASAAVVLRDVQSVHSLTVDRCYRVQYAPDPRHWDKTKKLEGPSQSVLWTRGDRFWSDCTVGDIRLTIGRQADGTLWVSPSRRKGIRFANGESRLPGEVALICAVNSMSVPRLVDDVLADFDLRADEPVGDAGRTRTIVWAALKPGRSHALLSHALLEIDENNVLARLVLWTVRDGKPRGTVTYTLLESRTQGDEQYRMTTHLDADATIESQEFEPAASDG